MSRLTGSCPIKVNSTFDKSYLAENAILVILISINYYFAGTYQRTGGGCEVHGELWDRGLLVEVVSRARHSTVSFHRV